ncbi:RNA-directed DNA polymerase [Burkholderia cenocepacia]|uniref:RNA-directed DNA polymerase n=1 Tax=Burkholderia cenocepacia TaxID=95486 RepID=UPI00285D2075|nr:RNA-directed DNA polymerase [Burkholderia cenocepacia]MDR8105062.1 RNA-directed DNA polymerase [Burkholderia cenocepacia]
MLTLQAASLDWALAHVRRFGDTDVFPVPFEYEALSHDWLNVRPVLEATDVLQWTTRPLRILLSPKGRYAFRVVTQLDPLDFLIFAAVVHELAADLEARRVPVADGRVFSYRTSILADGQLFSPDFGYRQFLDACRHKLLNEPRAAFVATADISDFFARIYHHRLENALHTATTKTNHVRAVMRLLSGWNGTETFGIPIGSAPSRLLAEMTLADVDEALLAAGIDFVRFNDDYRIFAQNYEHAYRAIAFLADTLYRNHGLTLQPQKTEILAVQAFQARFLTTPLDRELDSLYTRFEELAAELGIDNWYEPIEYDDLTAEQQDAIDSLNLVQLFQEELQQEEPDLPVLRFVLRRLGQLGDPSIVEEIFGGLNKLHPALPDVCLYVQNLRHLDLQARAQLGARMLNLLNGTAVSELPYHRMWILDLFVHSREWDNEGRFFGLYGLEPDQGCRRNLILAMGRAHQAHWFQSQWRTLFDQPHWPRRALLAGASCMAPDARRHWYRSVEPQLDVLELAVMRWARQNPF